MATKHKKKIVSKSKSAGKTVPKPTCPKYTYFDNNGTTLICNAAKKAHAQWLECYNPSASSRHSQAAHRAIDKVRDQILSHCNVSTATHTAIFTSGASESNCFIIRSCVKAYRKKLMQKNSTIVPHLILSAVEHKASILCAEDLAELGDIEVTYIKPSIYGNIRPHDVEANIKPNTCLVSIMYANNEIPVINNIKEIANIAHAHNVPVHSDAVQIFGKFPMDIKSNKVDAMSASAHKFYGPKGVGILIINNDLIEGYGLTAEVSGSQQGGLRGGTENVAGIVSTMAALKHAFTSRTTKNRKLMKLRTRFLNGISKFFKIVPYETYIGIEVKMEDGKKFQHQDLELVSLGPPEKEKNFILPNTVLLAVCKNKGRPFCNVDLKNYLDKKGFIVSIGSACNTSSKKSSHVMDAIEAPPVIRRGVIRISFGDCNTVTEVDAFIKALKMGIEYQCRDI